MPLRPRRTKTCFSAILTLSLPMMMHAGRIVMAQWSGQQAITTHQRQPAILKLISKAIESVWNFMNLHLEQKNNHRHPIGTKKCRAKRSSAQSDQNTTESLIKDIDIPIVSTPHHTITNRLLSVCPLNDAEPYRLLHQMKPRRYHRHYPTRRSQPRNYHTLNPQLVLFSLRSPLPSRKKRLFHAKSQNPA